MLAHISHVQDDRLGVLASRRVRRVAFLGPVELEAAEALLQLPGVGKR